MKNDWGYSNDATRFNEINQFVADAVADGWTLEQTYDSEPSMRACKLKREGFVISVITRKNVGKWKYEANIHAWAPDKLAVIVPAVYSWDAFKDSQTTCNLCLKAGVETQRYSFAGRCCADCIEQARKDHEQPGWCD